MEKDYLLSSGDADPTSRGMASENQLRCWLCCILFSQQFWFLYGETQVGAATLHWPQRVKRCGIQATRMPHTVRPCIVVNM